MGNCSPELRPVDLAELGVQEREFETWLPVAELHCPPAPGCRAEYTFAVQEQRRRAFNLEIFGFGGGSSRSRRLSYGQCLAIEAGDGCQQILQKVEMVLWAGLTGGGFLGAKPRFEVQLNIRDIPDDCRVESMPEDRDQCQSIRTDPEAFTGGEYENIGLDLTATTGVLMDSVELTKTVKLWWGLPIDLAGWASVPISLSLRLEGELSTQVISRYEYTLAPGHKYLGVRDKNDLGYCWTTR